MDKTSILPKNLFAGQVAVITGGGSGINLGIARTLASHGAAVAICGRSEARLKSAAAELAQFDGAVHAGVADVRDAAALKIFVADVEKSLGSASILVCGAAGNFLAPAEQLSTNGFKTVIDIDLLGTFNAASAAFAQLKQTRGSIVFVSAGQSYMPYAFQVHAGAAKAGVDQLMRNLALEWGRYGIRVNSVVPGPIEGTEGMRKLANPAELEMFVSSIPLQRLGQAEEIGHAVAFLSSPLAAYVTGTQLVCDGGQNLGGSALLNMSIGRMLAKQTKALSMAGLTQQG